MNGLELDGTVSLEDSELRFEVSLERHSHVVVIGPNGAGKSTLLRTLAGLTRLSSGSLTYQGQDLDSPRTHTFVPAHQRPIALQLQDGALFPHLSVLDNVAFPGRTQGLSRSSARAQAHLQLARTGVSDLAGRAPATLSGGQAAKVALARSLAADPEVLLLDEPAASLDVTARAELRHVIADLDNMVVTVTHDPVEARLLGQQMVVLDAGETVQVGTPDQVAAAPANRWVAGILGVNIVTGTATGTAIAADGGGRLHAAEAAEGRVHVTFPATAVTLHSARPEGSARNVFETTVTALVVEGDRVRVAFNAGFDAAAIVTTAASAELDLRPGSRVWASLKATELAVLPA